MKSKGWTFWKQFIVGLIVASVIISQTVTEGFAQRSRQPNRKPNIIFILADDLGYGDLGCYGQKLIRTPNLDRMAAEGVRFTQVYAGSTVCAPSRAALMTGFHTGHGYIRGNGDIPLRPRDVTVAEVLKTAGYTTSVIGKWGLGTVATTGRPDQQGFDESFGYLDHTHAHRQYTNHLWKNGEVFPVNLEKDYANDLFAQAALDFIGRNSSRPFFLYLALTVPHAELRVPEDSLKEYQGKFPETPFVNAKADAVPSHPPAKERRPTIGYRSQPTPRAAFAAMVTRMDRHVGQILARLRELGIDDNTIVFFSSDNGPHREGGADPQFFKSAGPLRGIKRDLYEGGIRVPMIVRWPGRIKSGSVSNDVWAFWDFLPTAAEIARATAPNNIDGISMLPALLGRRQRPHQYLYWEFFERGFHQAVRMGDWKAVRLGLEKPLELYNLRNDLGEQINIAQQHPDVVARIETILKTARTESEHWPARKSKVETSK